MGLVKDADIWAPPPRFSKGRSRGGSKESVSNKIPTVDNNADVPWTHSEKHCCVQEAHTGMLEKTWRAYVCWGSRKAREEAAAES